MEGTRRSTRKAPAAETEAETEDIQIQEPMTTMKTTRQKRATRATRTTAMADTATATNIATATATTITSTATAATRTTKASNKKKASTITSTDRMTTSTDTTKTASKARKPRAKKNTAAPVEEEDQIQTQIEIEEEKEAENPQNVKGSNTKGRAKKAAAPATTTSTSTDTKTASKPRKPRAKKIAAAPVDEEDRIETQIEQEKEAEEDIQIQKPVTKTKTTRQKRATRTTATAATATATITATAMTTATATAMAATRTTKASKKKTTSTITSTATSTATATPSTDTTKTASKARKPRTKKNTAAPVDEEDQIEPQIEEEKEAEDLQNVKGSKTKGRAKRAATPVTTTRPCAKKDRGSKTEKNEEGQDQEAGVDIRAPTPATAPPTPCRSMRSTKSATPAPPPTPPPRRLTKKVAPARTADTVAGEDDEEISDEDARAIGAALKGKGRGAKKGVTKQVIAKKVKGRAARGKKQPEPEPEEDIQMDDGSTDPKFEVVVASPAKKAPTNEPEPEVELEEPEPAEAIGAPEEEPSKPEEVEPQPEPLAEADVPAESETETVEPAVETVEPEVANPDVAEPQPVEPADVAEPEAVEPELVVTTPAEGRLTDQAPAVVPRSPSENTIGVSQHVADNSLNYNEIFPSSFEDGGEDTGSSPVKLPRPAVDGIVSGADAPLPLATPSRPRSVWASDPLLGTPIVASTPAGVTMVTPYATFGSPLALNTIMGSDSPVKSPAKPSTPIKVFSPATGGSSKSVKSILAIPKGSSVVEDGHRLSVLSPATSKLVAGKGRSPVKQAPGPGQAMSSPLGPRKRPYDEISSDGFSLLFATPVAGASAPKRQTGQASSPSVDLAALPSPVFSPLKPRATEIPSSPATFLPPVSLPSSQSSPVKRRSSSPAHQAAVEPGFVKDWEGGFESDEETRGPGDESRITGNSMDFSPIKTSGLRPEVMGRFIGSSPMRHASRLFSQDGSPRIAISSPARGAGGYGIDIPSSPPVSAAALERPQNPTPMRARIGPTPTSSPPGTPEQQSVDGLVSSSPMKARIRPAPANSPPGTPEQQSVGDLESSSPFEENVSSTSPGKSPKRRLSYVDVPLAGVDGPSTPPEKRLKANVEEAPDSLTRRRYGRRASIELAHMAAEAAMDRLRALARGYLVRKHTEALREEPSKMTGSGVLDSFIRKHDEKTRIAPKSSLPIPKAAMTSKIPRAMVKAPNERKVPEAVYLPPVEGAPTPFSPLVSDASAVPPSSPWASPRTRKRSAEDPSGGLAKKQATEGVRRSGRAAVRPPTISLAPAAPRPAGPLTWETMLERERKELVKKNTNLNCMPTPHKRQVERKPIARPPSPTAALQTKAAADGRRKRKAHLLETGVELGPGESPSSGFVPKEPTPPKRGVRWGAPLESGNGSDAETHSPTQARLARIDGSRLAKGPVALDKFGNLEGASPPKAGTSPVVIKKVLYKGEKA